MHGFFFLEVSAFWEDEIQFPLTASSDHDSQKKNLDSLLFKKKDGETKWHLNEACSVTGPRFVHKLSICRSARPLVQRRNSSKTLQLARNEEALQPGHSGRGECCCLWERPL